MHQPLYCLRALGPFFTLHVGALRGDPEWTPVPALLEGSAAAGERMDALVHQTANALGTTELWIAASIWFQAWAAHLTAVHLGSATLGGPVPDLSACNLHFRFGAKGEVELGADPVVDTDAGNGSGSMTQLVGTPWAQPRLTSADGRWVPVDGEPCYARMTCCGYERLPGASRCGDCSRNWRGRRGHS